MTSGLVRCDTLWGTCDRIAGMPGLRRVSGAVYLPYRPDGAWGLFGEEGRLTETGRDPTPGDDPGHGPGHGQGEGAPEPEPVDLGPALYLGPLITHYGHFLINTLPRLWPLATDSGARGGPRLRLVCHRFEPPGAWDGLEFLAAILGGLGYRIDQVESFERPVRIAELIVPEPALVEQAAVHDVFGQLCRRIGRPFWDEAQVDTQERPVWLSKTGLGQGIARIVNEAELEHELARRGVEIVSPEASSFADQVRLISRRRIVMGSAGSAFHTTAFAAPGRRVVGLNWQLALNANFALVDRVSGTDARYYHWHGTRYRTGAVQDTSWQVAWTLPDPRAAATGLLARAERLARGRPDPGRLALAGERVDRTVRARLRRLAGG